MLVLAAWIACLPFPAPAAPPGEDPPDLLLATESDFDIETWGSAGTPGGGPPPAILVVESQPAGAEVYLNHAYAGMTPLTVKDLPPGGYRVSLQRKNYREASVFLTLDPGRTFRVFGRLRSETGALRVSPRPADAEIYVDGLRIRVSEGLFPVGTHRVTARRFGYQDFSADVLVQADRTTELAVPLSPAVFAARDFTVSRKRLNPDNPGLTGRSDLDFSVTAPGRGRIILYAADGTPVRTHVFPDFSTWAQSFRWDGRDDAGRPLPDGPYRALLSVESRDGKIQGSMAAEVVLDRSLLIRYRSIHHGQPGLMYAPLTSSLPAGSFQLGTLFAGEADRPGGGEWERRYAAQLGAVVGLAAGLELTPVLSLEPLADPGEPRLDASLGLKYALRKDDGGPFSLSATLGGHVSSSPAYAGLSRFPGLTAGAVLGLRFGSLGFAAAPELLVSPYRIGDNGGAGREPGLDAAVLSRFGLYLETGPLLAGFSTVLAARTGSGPPRLLYPIHTGFEVHGLLPDSLLFLSAFLSWEYSPDRIRRLFLGTGLGIVY